MDLSTLRAFHFLQPAWLFALVPLGALLAWFALRRARAGSWSQVIDSDLLPALRLEGEQHGSAPWWVFAAVWTLAVVALAGPAWQRLQTPAFRAPQDWVLLLDLSPSMAARDVTPDRVTRARYIIDDILAAARDARVALIVFGGDTHTVTPLTTDVETVRALLQPLTPDIMPVVGDRAAPALDAAGQLLRSVASREARIVVLSDGFADPAQAFKSAAQLRAQGASVQVMGIGTESGAPAPGNDGRFTRDAQGRPQLVKLPIDLLQRLAASGGGEYSSPGREAQFIATLQRRRADPLASEQMGDMQLDTWRNEGVWLLPPLLLLAALIARRGWV